MPVKARQRAGGAEHCVFCRMVCNAGGRPRCSGMDPRVALRFASLARGWRRWRSRREGGTHRLHPGRQPERSEGGLSGIQSVAMRKQADGSECGDGIARVSEKKPSMSRNGCRSSGFRFASSRNRHDARRRGPLPFVIHGQAQRSGARPEDPCPWKRGSVPEVQNERVFCRMVCNAGGRPRCSGMDPRVSAVRFRSCSARGWRRRRSNASLARTTNARAGCGRP